MLVEVPPVTQGIGSGGEYLMSSSEMGLLVVVLMVVVGFLVVGCWQFLFCE